MDILRMLLMAGAQAEKNARKKRERLLAANAKAEQTAREKREQRTLICPSCRVEFAAKARCCIKCGSKTVITVAQLKKRDAAEADARLNLRWEREAAEKAAQAKLDAEIRYREETQRAALIRRIAAK